MKRYGGGSFSSLILEGWQWEHWVFSPQPEAEVSVQYFTPEHPYCLLAGGGSEQYQIHWGGSAPETFNVFSSPCPGEEGSDTAALWTSGTQPGSMPPQ